MTAPLRVLVTGSRSWASPRDVWSALDTVAAQHPGRTLVVVHGACRTGADAHASVWAGRARDAGWDVVEEQHPADWAQYGRRAGPIRNQLMVDLGADLCLAFPAGASHGTRGCMQFATLAGIPVRALEGRVDAEVTR